MISRLDFRTSYEIKVNGFNEVGHGPPGNLIILETLQKGEHMQSGSALLACYCDREQKCDVTKIQILEIMGLIGVFRKNKIKKPPLPKIGLLAHTGGEI